MEIYDGLPRHIRDVLKFCWVNPCEVIELLYPGRPMEQSAAFLRFDDLRLHEHLFNVALSRKVVSTRTGDRYFPSIGPDGPVLRHKGTEEC